MGMHALTYLKKKIVKSFYYWRLFAIYKTQSLIAVNTKAKNQFKYSKEIKKHLSDNRNLLSGHNYFYVLMS